MALVNPNIAMSYRAPEIQPQNMLADYAAIQQIQSGRQAQELNALKMQEAQATMQERNALRQLNPSAPDYESQLFKVNPTLGIAYRKEAGAAAAQKATEQKTLIEAATAKQGMMSQAYRDISSRPSDANIMAHTEDIQASSLFSDAEKRKALATQQTLLAMPIEERTAYLASQGAKASELKPTTNVGPTGIVQTPAFGGPATVVPGTSAAFGMTPAQIEANKIAQGQLGVSQQRLGLEGQRVGLERERVGIARTEAERKMQGLEALPPKEIQKREAALPQATSAVQGFESKSNKFIADLTALRNDPGLENITGAVFGRTGSVSREGSRAQALYDKVVAKGGFQALQDLRDASKTGGALGNVSNQEGKQLTASFSAIDRRQNAADVRAAIDQAIADIEGSKTRMREAYDATYAYKSGGAPAVAESSRSAVPAAAAGALSPAEQAELAQLRKRFGK